ncbi:Tetratricopeptide repeat protein [Pseudomonas syringae pv. cilantro]|uniref:Tetratricopeptide repeat protein n=1 Tax=Pseudomonas syringae pv. cilantro TaxID=81035 RepID=A0A0N0GFN0_PSESX|nr:Tetratricopeptide repeat protein [Pseudomonas syringae pv. cilantro]
MRGIAGQLADFTLALSANDQLPHSPDKQFWGTLLLYETRKFRACYQGFGAYVGDVDRSHPLFGAAVTAASISAHKSVQTGLVN